MKALSRGLPGDRIMVGPDVVGALSHDEAEWAPTGKAVAAVRARSEAEVHGAEQSSDDAEAEALFDARRLAYPAFERLGPVLTEDVCVPRSKVPAVPERIAAIGASAAAQDEDLGGELA